MKWRHISDTVALLTTPIQEKKVRKRANVGVTSRLLQPDGSPAVLRSGDPVHAVQVPPGVAVRLGKERQLLGAVDAFNSRIVSAQEEVIPERRAAVRGLVGQPIEIVGSLRV